jgi:hypothetical protein
MLGTNTNLDLVMYLVSNSPRTGCVQQRTFVKEDFDHGVIDQLASIPYQSYRMGRDNWAPYPLAHRLRETTDYIKAIINTEGALEYLVDVVIPEKYGDLNPNVRTVTLDLLRDETQWDEYALVGTDFGANGPSWHVDGRSYFQGKVKCSVSPSFGTWTIDGETCFDNEDSHIPLISSDHTLKVAGEYSLVMWEYTTGLHRSPIFGAEGLPVTVDSRHQIAQIFGFDRAVLLAHSLVRDVNETGLVVARQSLAT